MSDAVVHVENLGKRYEINRATAGGRLTEQLAEGMKFPFEKLKAMVRGRSRETLATAPAPREPDHIWALRNVSFEVPRGQILGIIGRNGAGKSTLLKILSRITEPTEGRVEIRGRVASLLEVGTGFHPELTGRENVYLSGALLGMRKSEIDRKFDEIVEFAGVREFLGTPVRHYSSGMYVRLAFAVAAHLEPDILIVDEVLAVGDVSFQRKCLAKMEDVREHGRTILFVSHNLSAVTRLCERAILVAGGAVRSDGPAGMVASEYMMQDLATSTVRVWNDLATAPASEVVRLRSVRVCDEQGRTAETVDIRRQVGIEIVYEVLKAGHVLAPWCEFINESGLCLFVSLGIATGWRSQRREVGSFVSTAWVPGNLLSEGTVFVGAAVISPDPPRTHFHARDAVAFHVIDSLDGDAARGDWDGPLSGVVRPRLKWTTTPCGSSGGDHRE